MAGGPDLHGRRVPAASLVDPVARAAAFAALGPALEALASRANADPCLGVDARRVLRAIARTRPDDTLTPSGLAVRASTAKARVPAALAELHAHGYLSRVAAIAPHLAAALPEVETPVEGTPAASRPR